MVRGLVGLIVHGVCINAHVGGVGIIVTGKSEKNRSFQGLRRYIKVVSNPNTTAFWIVGRPRKAFRLKAKADLVAIDFQ